MSVCVVIRMCVYFCHIYVVFYGLSQVNYCTARLHYTNSRINLSHTLQHSVRHDLTLFKYTHGYWNLYFHRPSLHEFHSMYYYHTLSFHNNSSILCRVFAVKLKAPTQRTRHFNWVNTTGRIDSIYFIRHISNSSLYRTQY